MNNAAKSLVCGDNLYERNRQNTISQLLEILANCRVLTIHQPYASFLANGWKRNETRVWPTNYLGNLLIHASKRKLDDWHPEFIENITSKPFVATDYPLGEVVAIADFSDCYLMVNGTQPPDYETVKTINLNDIALVNDIEKQVGDWVAGNWAWHMKDKVNLHTPIPAIGKQRLWVPGPELLTEIVTKNWQCLSNSYLLR